MPHIHVLILQQMALTFSINKHPFLTAFLFAILVSFPALAATTYSVELNGGTAAQCDGKSSAPYPGSGTNKPCAWKHPFYALNSRGQWKLKGGDTLVIGTGSYRMGYGAPNTSWCDLTSTYDCHLPALPSGPSIAAPTRIIGVGWNSGCASKPQLWGTERANEILTLENTSNAAIQCLEITDHSGCVEFHATPDVACERDRYPHGDWAVTGIYAADSAGITLRDLNIHGLASAGVWAGRLSNWTVQNVRIAGNGWVGWNGDIAGEDSNTGTLHFKRWKVEWNGCAESYPGQTMSHCWAQQSGGYGDGVGTGPSAGHWIIEDSLFQYNTSDGLDLLYVGRVGKSRIDIRRTIARGNAGNQIKTNGSATIVNSLMVGNCGFFYQKPFATEMGPRMSGDHCRAYGNTLAMDVAPGNTVNVINSTIVGQGDVLGEFECTSTPCTNSKVVLQNNVFRGYPDFLQLGDQAAFLYDPSGLTRGNVSNNLVYNAKNQLCNSTNICADPLFVNDVVSAFDGHLKAGSRAIDTGLPVGSLNGLVPDHDLAGTTRPQGMGVDRGAYEYVSPRQKRASTDAEAQ